MLSRKMPQRQFMKELFVILSPENKNLTRRGSLPHRVLLKPV
jgi:hypothetical protein